MKKLSSILFIALLSLSLSAQEGEGSILKVGDALPTFTLTSAKHGTISSEDTKGKATLVVLFATWCGPCQLEMAVIEKTLYPKYKDNKDFQLIVIGREHTDEELATYNEKKNFSFPIYPDAKKNVTPLFATKYIPRSYLVDKSGKVVSAGQGFNQAKFDALLLEIEGLLK